MNNKKYLTLSFWTSIVAGVAMVAVALGLPQDTADAWQQMLIALIAAVLPIIALIRGYSEERAQLAMFSVDAEMPAWLTVEFWMTIITTIVMILVASGVLTPEQGDAWRAAPQALVAALITIAVYVRGRVGVQTVIAVKLLSR